MSRRTARTIRNFSLEVSPDLVLLNIRKLDFHDFHHFLKVTSSQNTFKLAPNGGPKGPLPWDPLGSQGSPPMGSLGLARVRSQGFPLPWVPSHGIPLGSQGSPPMGSHPTPSRSDSQRTPPVNKTWELNTAPDVDPKNKMGWFGGPEK